MSFSCRSCGASELTPVISLGELPLANALRTEEELLRQESTFPLDVVHCSKCTLVQITETVSGEQLFRDYAYFSSYSDTMLSHAEKLAERLILERDLRSDSLVAEVASNDGYLLQFYLRAGVPVLGIEPARNIAQVAEQRGITTKCEFFGAELAKELVSENGRADVLHANNVLAHVSDLNNVVEGIKTCLKDDAVAVIESPYVKDLLDRSEFDTIYHEHLCYYSITALDKLFARHELQITDVERISVHGGSIRLLVSHSGMVSPNAAVARLIEAEAEWVTDQSVYQQFANRVGLLRDRLTSLLRQLKSDGKRIAAYGAAAKGSTLLNHFGIGCETLDFVVDRNPVKQGRYTPGPPIPIYDPKRLINDAPDYVLLLTWNLADEILQQQSEYRSRGGKFIVPIPDVRII